MKALRGKPANGNGHVARSEWHALRDVVHEQGYAIKLVEHQTAGMQTTLDRHTDTLEDIRVDLSKIMAAVDRRQD